MAKKSKSKLTDPALAVKFFSSKLAFTNGAVEVKEELSQDPATRSIIVDVRAADDYAEGHIPGAISLPEDKWPTLEGLSKRKMNILYCYSQNCHLAARAAVFFAGKGFSVMEMDGGFEDWKGHDFDVESVSAPLKKKQAA